jgi:hypothetical protein
MKRIFYLTKGRAGLFVGILFFILSAICVLTLHHVDSATNDICVNYIQNFGWEVRHKPAQILHLTIPPQLDEAMVALNNLQKTIGLNIENYRGKKIMRFSYKVKNHIESKREVRADALVYKGKVIAASVYSAGENGFVHAIDDRAKICKKQ